MSDSAESAPQKAASNIKERIAEFHRSCEAHKKWKSAEVKEPGDLRFTITCEGYQSTVLDFLVEGGLRIGREFVPEGHWAELRDILIAKEAKP